MQKINLAEKFALIHEHWSPKIVAELNGQHLKLARLKGEFVWHRHPAEDELFLVLHGELMIRFRDGEATLREGEMIVVPAGVEHLPVAVEEVEVLLLEPASTRNTGDVLDDRTVLRPDWI
jgi:mannose-6-phosphate isomerase-like protein (cupin superfamily)